MKISPVPTTIPTYGWLTLHLRLMPLTNIPPRMTPMSDSDTIRISMLCPQALAAVPQALLHLTASNFSPRPMDKSTYTGLVPPSGLAMAKRDSLMPWDSPMSNTSHRRSSRNNHLAPYVCRMLSSPTDYIRHPCHNSPFRTICPPCILLLFVLLVGSTRGTSHSKKTLTPKARETYIVPPTRLTLLSAAQLVQLHP
jgi:hypothetical protein